MIDHRNLPCVQHAAAVVKAGKRLLACTLLGLLLQQQTFAQEEAARQGTGQQIGVLLYAEGFRAISRGLRDGLRQLGYADGDGLHVEVQVIDKDLAKIPSLLAQFLERRYDLVVTTTTPIARKVQQLTAGKPMPLLFTLVASPLDSRLVTSLRQPGNNISGINHIAFETLAKRLQLFKTAFPNLERVALFYNFQEQFLKGHVEKFLHPAATELGVELVQLHVTEPKQMQQHSASPAWRDIDGIMMLPDPLQVAMFDRLAALSRRHRLPFMVLDNQLLARGGVMGYSPNFYDVGLQAAEMAVAVLRGADIGRMPVQNPRRISLLVSLKEAARLGLSPSRDILIAADEIIR